MLSPVVDDGCGKVCLHISLTSVFKTMLEQYLYFYFLHNNYNIPHLYIKILFLHRLFCSRQVNTKYDPNVYFIDFLAYKHLCQFCDKLITIVRNHITNKIKRLEVYILTKHGSKPQSAIFKKFLMLDAELVFFLLRYQVLIY